MSNDAALNLHVDNSSGDTLPEELLTFQGEFYVKNAYKTFDVTKALDGCSFSANFGEIHAIVGGNGSGKSTLAKVLSGVLPLDSGKVSIMGHHPTTPVEARALGISTVFQEVLIADEATVVDNLFTGVDGFWTKAVPVKEKIKKARSLMHELADEDIDPLTPAGNLPLSIKAWITIGRALLRDPKILILDESSAALDFDSTERLFSKMRELRDKGAAVLIVTHRIAELIRISDRATVMRDGRDVGVLEKNEITEQNLLSLMTGKTESAASQIESAQETGSRQVVLRTTGVRVWLDSKPVDFGLFKGEIVGVTGLEGHGQEEFVRILAGVSEGYEGYPEVVSHIGNGLESITGLEDAKRNGISFVSGDRKREGILPNLSIFENLLFPLYRVNKRVPGLRFIDWVTLSDVFDWEVERLSIKVGDRSNLITSLSGGNQQKVMIGRSLALQPKILVLNDPARGIDVDTKRDLYSYLREFAIEGGSVVYMSSEIEEFIGFCSRVVVFRNGGIFDTFVNEAVEPVGILEGMFGRGKGGQTTSVVETDTNTTSGDIFSGTSSIMTEQKAFQNLLSDSHIRTGNDVVHVKVRDFDKEDSEPKHDREKIKISYFD